jgi:hypothetical protein
MARLDRLGWAAGLAFDCHGARLGVRLTDPAALERVRCVLPPGAQTLAAPDVDVLYSFVVGGQMFGSPVRRFHVLYVGVVRLARTLDLDVAVAALATDLHRAVSSAARRVFVSAGVVVVDGRAIVILGPRGSGRTTLVRALLRSGATFASDMFAVFDEWGQIHPYAAPAPIFPDYGVGGSGQRAELALLAYDGGAASAPVPLGLVVETRYRPGAQWQPDAGTPAQAVLALMRHAVHSAILPAVTLKTLGVAVARASMLRGPRGECLPATAALLKCMREQPIPMRA